MSTDKDIKTLLVNETMATGITNNPTLTQTSVSRKSARKVQGVKTALSKADARFWLRPRKLFKWEDSANYSLQLQFKGRRMAFSTGTGNKEGAARIAAGIYSDLLTLGIEGTLAKHRPEREKPPLLTLGQWITQAHTVFDKSPTTFDAYARAARMIGADILKVKRDKKRFGRKSGSFRTQADASPLSIFSARAVQEWKIRYVKERGGDNPSRQRAARISCNSALRAARSLFQGDIAKHLPALEMEEKPFAGVDFYPRESMRYHSKIDPSILLATAREELSQANPEAFKVLLLALGAGLRRGEIDRLLWRQIDLDGGEIHIEVTEAGDLKSADSTGKVAIDSTLCGLLRGFKAKARGQYVIEGRAIEGGARAWGQRYRCGEALDSLLAWLRKNGVEDRRALHTLRKEAGSIIATKSGIYAASRFLRHSDIKVTAQHYADNKERIAIDLGGLMTPEDAIPFPSGESEDEAQPATKGRKKSA